MPYSSDESKGKILRLGGASERVIEINRGEQGKLILADGTIFEGRLIGHQHDVVGEIVVHTAMTGYQEVLTDPTSAGQLVVFTFPLIGSYGVLAESMQSDRVHAKGIVTQDVCSHPSNWRSQGKLDAFLKEHKTVGLMGIDTRALARHLRGRGAMQAVISVKDGASLLKEGIEPIDLLHVTTPAPKVSAEGSGARITVVDFGVRRSILRELADRNCYVTVVPGHFSADEILKTRPDGVVLSNGPGDPSGVIQAPGVVAELSRRVPVFGIGLGHQIVALAFGAQTFRLTHAHRGANHPVKDLGTGRVYMTFQNHGFAVKDASWPHDELIVSHKNVNDSTVEGLVHKTLPVSSVQYYPEGSPGPQQSSPLDEFIRRLSMSA